MLYLINAPFYCFIFFYKLMEELVTDAKRWGGDCCEWSPAGSKTMRECIKSDNTLASWPPLFCALGHHLLMLPCKGNQASLRRPQSLSIILYILLPREDWGLSPASQKCDIIKRILIIAKFKMRVIYYKIQELEINIIVRVVIAVVISCFCLFSLCIRRRIFQQFDRLDLS